MYLHPALIVFFIITTLSCQRQPSISPAAEPSARKADKPMGSSTTNVNFLRKQKLLDDLLKNKSIAEINKSEENKLLVEELFAIIPKDTLTKAPTLTNIEKKLLHAEFYFYERRFIEAAHQLSQILDSDGDFPRARNLLARCFYFLGNADRAQLELDHILVNPKTNIDNLLDGLFLMGAISLESPDSNEDMLTKGIRAWETYLKVAPENELTNKIKPGLVELKEKLSQSKAGLLKAPPIVHVKKTQVSLKKQALNAFDKDDLLLAEKKCQEFMSTKASDPEIETAMARILIRTNRISEALALFKKITTKHSSHIPAWHYQGMAFIMSANPQKAIESWQKVLEKDSKYAEQYNLPGRIAVAQGMIHQ